MLTTHRPQLIQDLTDTALGLIAEAEQVDQQEARVLVELAGTLDRLRVEMISDTRVLPQRYRSAPKCINAKHH